MKWVKRRELGDGRLATGPLAGSIYCSQKFPSHRTWNLYTHSGNKHWENMGKLSKVPSFGFLVWKIKLYPRCQPLCCHTSHFVTWLELRFNSVSGQKGAVFIEENRRYYYPRQSIIQWCCHRQQEIIRVRLSPRGQEKMVADQIMSFEVSPHAGPR